MKLRVACLQFNPLLGKVDANLAKISSLLSSFHKEIDLLVLPELAITGYNFSSPKAIEPFLEQAGSGPSFNIAQELSKRFACTTVIGYPETFEGTTYNSAVVVDAAGAVVSNYRKTHLYETDEVWGCSENPSKDFTPVQLRLGTLAAPITANIGICMDLNPYQFKAPFNAFEFSLKCWENQASLVIVPTAWLSSESPSISETDTAEKKAADAKNFQEMFATNTFPEASTTSDSLVNYWILRFFPFLRHPQNGLPETNKKTTVVICNRTGIEDDVLYGGSSCILRFGPCSSPSGDLDAKNPSVEVCASAGRASEQVIYSEIEM